MLDLSTRCDSKRGKRLGEEEEELEGLHRTDVLSVGVDSEITLRIDVKLCSAYNKERESLIRLI